MNKEEDAFAAIMLVLLLPDKRADLRETRSSVFVLVLLGDFISSAVTLSSICFVQEGIQDDGADLEKSSKIKTVDLEESEATTSVPPDLDRAQRPESDGAFESITKDDDDKESAPADGENCEKPEGLIIVFCFDIFVESHKVFK